MRASFLFGDFLQYLAQCKKTFDLIFASGVLYHMEDPLNLLHLIAQHTDRVFLWTLYMSETAASLTPVFKNPVLEGYSCRYFRYDYNNENSGRIYSGNDSYCCRMTRDDILGALRAFGFSQIRIMKDEEEADSGPNLAVVAFR
jgi:hypothetical protein